MMQKFNVIRFLIISILLILSAQLKAQELDQTQHEIGFQIGFGVHSILEKRFSSKAKNLVLPTIGFMYNKRNSKKREEFIMTMTFGRSENGLLSFKIIQPDVSYNYQRKYKDVWLGGFIQFPTLLNFPITKTNVFTNNPISYTVSAGIGPSLRYEKILSSGENSRFTVEHSTKFSLLNYVIRPAYAHPYPDQFLKEENFDPTQKGMAGSLIKSGKIKTINKHQSIQVVFGINYYSNSNIKVGLRYAFQYQNDVGDHNAYINSSKVLLAISYLK